MNENPPNKINYKRNLFMEKTNSYTFKGFKATNEDFRQCLSECIKEIKSIDTKLDLILSQQKKVIQMEEKLRYQVTIWTSIALVFILYFIVMALIYMPNPKSSILYAKYDTTRAEHEA